MATTFLVVKNDAISTLASGINDSVTSLDVAAGEGALFPSTYPFHISIDSEILSCTNRSTDTLTVTRHQQGTSAAAHSAGAAVELRVTAQSVTDLNSAVNTLEGKMPDTTHPVTQAFSDAADEGVASTVARIDHKHGMMANPVTIVRKTADQTVNNSIVLVNDTHLKLTIAASEIWLVQLFLLRVGNATADFNMGWSYPTGCSIYWGTVPDNIYNFWEAISTTPYALRIQTDTWSIGDGTAITGNIITAIVINGVNSGTLNFQWAQNTQTVANTKVLTNSYLIAHKLS